MSIDLGSLAGTGGVVLDDLVSKPNVAEMPINNKGTANSLSAHAALLVEPEAAVDTYNTLQGELATNQGSPTLDRITQEANQRETELNVQQMGEILADETIPLDQKVAYASLWRTGEVQAAVERSPEELLAVNQLGKDGVESNNAEVEETRLDLAGAIREVNAYNDEIQRVINMEDVKNNPNLLGATKDFLETVVPFMEGAAAAEVQTRLRRAMDQGDANSVATGVLTSLGLLGESKQQIADMLSKVPLEKRLQVAQTVYDMVLASEGSITGGKNSLILMNNLRDFLVEGHYTASDRFVDDVSSVLDIFGLGATLRSIKSGAKSAANAARFTRRVPKSAAETVAQTNAKSANELFKMAVDDESGKVAEAVYGANRQDAIVQTLGPEIDADVVRHKPLIDDDQFDPDYDAIRQISSGHGNIQYKSSEKASKLEQVTNDFTNPDVSGLVARKEMTTIKAVDEGVQVKTIFGPAEGGFKNAHQAVNQVKLATRKYGLLDEEITVLKRGKDGNYKPVDLNSKEANLNGNYLVSINHTSKYDPTDTIAWGVTDVQGKAAGLVPLNIFDRLDTGLKGKSGSITQHLVPNTAIIDPTLTRSASVTADQAAHSANILIDIGNEYGSQFKALSKEQQGVFEAYILEANHKSLKFNPTKLRADGWTPEMMSTLRSWKRAQDTLYTLENLDLVRQSRRKGYQWFSTTDGQDQFMVKPIPNTTAGNLKVTKVYDPEIGNIRAITSKERTELYANGGSIAIARTPVVIGDQSIAYVKVSNNSHNYSRALRDTDKLLTYRDGYFTVYYKNPIFITKKVKNADGTEYTRAIASSENIGDAERELSRLRETDPEGAYGMRTDVKGEEMDEMLWNTRTNNGRTAQRTRGELLQDVTDRPQDLNFRHIASPEESLLRSINSIARRINYKEFLDVAKKRFMEQYDEYLPIDPNTHAKKWPDDVTQLRNPGLEGNAKDFADAKSTFRYIDQQENGFINLIDDNVKSFFKTMADTAGKKGWGWAETGARAASGVNPTAFARKQVFRLLLAANPIRQKIVQASQALPVIGATNPTFAIKLPFQMILTSHLDRGGDVESLMKSLGSKWAGLSMEEAHALAKAYKASGISSAVSAHSLIRDDLKALVNRGVMQKVTAAAGKPLDWTQRWGFEASENMLMRSVWLSEYDLLKKSGKPINAENLSLLHARVRDLTLNMNKAGELAYNENSLSFIMQFAQAQHKALGQILVGNRALSGYDRAKLGTAYVLTYGTGYGLIGEYATSFLPKDDRVLHDVVTGGIANLALNRTLSTIYGEDVNVDFSSSMRLLEIPKLQNMWEAMATMDLGTLAETSPALSLLASDNGKLGNLIKSMGRVFTAPEDDGRYKDVGINFLSMYSGISNLFKARYAFRAGQQISTKGEVVDNDVNKMEAFMRVAGFATVDEMLQYQANENLYFNSKQFKDDLKYLFDETGRRLGREGISEEETEYQLYMLSEAARVYGDNPQAMEQVKKEIQRRAKTGDFVILNRIIEQSGLTSASEMEKIISEAPLTADQKRQLWKIIDFMKEPE